MSRLRYNSALLFTLCICFRLRMIHTGTIITTIQSQYKDKTMTCATGQPCNVICQTIDGCRNTTIYCAAGQTCDVTCNESRACWQSIIHAEHSSFFRLLDCASGSLTCIGIILYFPPNTQGVPKSKLIGADVGLSAGSGLKYPLHFYAIHSWKDINITTAETFSFAAHGGVMHCNAGYTATCNFEATGWHCANPTDSCFVAHPTVSPTQATSQPTRTPSRPPTPAPTQPTLHPTPPPTYVTANPLPTSYPPTPLPTRRPTPLPTRRPTAYPTARPTARPTAIPTTAPSITLVESDCISISNLHEHLNGDWHKSMTETSGGHAAYSMEDHWLYYVGLKSQGHWMIGSTVGSTDWNTIDAFCVNEEVTKCSGIFSVRSNTGTYTIDAESVVVSGCSSTTTTKTPTRGKSNSDNDGSGIDETEEPWVKFEGGNMILSGYIIPWYALAVVGAILLLCCGICCMMCCKQRQMKKKRKQNQYRNARGDKHGDRVQMIKKQNRTGQPQGHSPYNQRRF